jgi:hypothetical protein
MSMKNSTDTIGNRIRYLPVCIAVPQSTAPPRWLTVVKKQKFWENDTHLQGNV